MMKWIVPMLLVSQFTFAECTTCDLGNRFGNAEKAIFEDYENTDYIPTGAKMTPQEEKYWKAKFEWVTTFKQAQSCLKNQNYIIEEKMNAVMRDVCHIKGISAPFPYWVTKNDYPELDKRLAVFKDEDPRKNPECARLISKQEELFNEQEKQRKMLQEKMKLTDSNKADYYRAQEKVNNYMKDFFGIVIKNARLSVVQTIVMYSRYDSYTVRTDYLQPGSDWSILPENTKNDLRNPDFVQGISNKIINDFYNKGAYDTAAVVAGILLGNPYGPEKIRTPKEKQDPKKAKELLLKAKDNGSMDALQYLALASGKLDEETQTQFNYAILAKYAGSEAMKRFILNNKDEFLESDPDLKYLIK